MLDLNIRAATLCLQEAVKDMRTKEEAVIINIGSISGHRLVQGFGGSFYAATKSALRVLTDGLRFELAEEKSPIKLCMISPGLVDTEFHQIARGKKPEFNFSPLQASDIADAVLYILSTPPTVQISDLLIRGNHQTF